MNEDQMKQALQDRFQSVRFDGEAPAVAPLRRRTKWLAPFVASVGLLAPTIGGLLLFMSPGCTYERAAQALQDAKEFRMEMQVDRPGGKPFRIVYEYSNGVHRRVFDRPLSGGIMVWDGKRSAVLDLQGTVCQTQSQKPARLGTDNQNPLPGEKAIEYVLRTVWLNTSPLTPGSEKPVAKTRMADEQGRMCDVLSFYDDQGYFRTGFGDTIRSVRTADMWLEPGTGRPIIIEVREPSRVAGVMSKRRAKLSYSGIPRFDLTSTLKPDGRTIDMDRLRSTTWSNWTERGPVAKLGEGNVFAIYRSMAGWALLEVDKELRSDLKIHDSMGRAWSGINLGTVSNQEWNTSSFLVSPVEPLPLDRETEIWFDTGGSGRPVALKLPAPQASPPDWFPIVSFPMRAYKYRLQPPTSSANYYRSVRDWKNELRWMQVTLELYGEYGEQPLGTVRRIKYLEDIVAGRAQPPPVTDTKNSGGTLYALPQPGRQRQ